MWEALESGIWERCQFSVRGTRFLLARSSVSLSPVSACQTAGDTGTLHSPIAAAALETARGKVGMGRG
jgi:hypothetical protein